MYRDAGVAALFALTPVVRRGQAEEAHELVGFDVSEAGGPCGALTRLADDWPRVAVPGGGSRVWHGSRSEAKMLMERVYLRVCRG